ncbi:secreted Ly-6/uPAR domain-containing protein 2 [Cricetulus griseus]|uniref:Secreted Ly-6/uPAR domain-containing protein 2 n=1 Tax=Cricetulus griseus TaxID=10029 RepID=G3I919_CRIGR|nr:secreted Ly-6/uPAR domain-containing protein 2 [Cricetulus griseus]XP_027259612.1 secreted Ly-6/uPAR domain-containing protein 2 [Cricetulus griseus]EGV97383.1 Secreted Ly-6/uPAR-related protein 2 [Cricetulus griseus]
MRLLFWFLLAVVLSMELAITEGLWCHLCKDFGGCSGKYRCPGNSTHCVIIATRSPISFTDLPLVTKMCYNGCPEVRSLGLGPHVSIVCCQSNLCNRD